MTRLARFSSLALCALAAGLAPAAAAAQEENPERPSNAREMVLFLEGSNGYEAFLVTFGNQVIIEVGKAQVGALYAVRGRVSERRISAGFGRLGRVSGRFERVGLFGDKERPDANGCQDPFSFVTFEGTISFRGEGGYTSIEARRSGGFLSDPAAQQCKRRARTSAAPGGTSLDTHFSAIDKRAGVVTSFTLSRKRGQSRARVEAWREERRDEVYIVRGAETMLGGENALIASGPGVHPPFAFVAPPKPFSGSGLFDPTAPPGAEWAGSLAAWLPGLGKVGLTGPRYALSLCRRASHEPGCNPEAPVISSLSRPQGSGSQSQALGEARLSWSRYLRNSASSAGSTP